MRRALPLLLVLVGIGAVGSWAAADPAQRSETAEASGPGRAATVTREALATLEAQLDRSVDSVSLPRVTGLLTRDAARSYRLPGYGVVFVLTPRALPGERRDFLVHVTPRHRGAAPRAGRPEASDEGGSPPEIETLERQVIVLQNEAEQARRAAEQDMERIVHDLRMRLTGTRAALEPTSSAPDAPSDEHRPAPEAPLPPPPPWKFWFESDGTRDERTPQAMIADVRQAVVEALGSQGARITGLRPEEYVTVAVDFEVADPFTTKARPQRTLVVRARAADIAAHGRATIDLGEFRRRVEVLEY